MQSVFQPNVQIVIATPDHLDILVHMENECFSLPWDRAAIHSELADIGWSRTFLAIANTSPAGYACIWTVADEIQLLKVGVKPEFQRQHIGKTIIEHLIHMGREEGLSEISLELRESNTPALRLYRSCHFEESGRRKGYYSDTGEDAILMCCKLIP